MAVKTSVQRIPLDRRICIIHEERIDIRPSAGAIVVPLVGVFLSIVCFVVIGLTMNVLPLVILTLLLIPSILVFPLAAMGLVYSLVGTHLIIDGNKQSAAFQQGLLGLGVGTREIVPFGKIDHVAVAEASLGEGEARGPLSPIDVRGWDIVLVKSNGKRLPIGMVMVAQERELAEEGFGRAIQVAEAIARLVGRPMQVEAEPGEDGG